MNAIAEALGLGRRRGPAAVPVRAALAPRLTDLALALYCASIIIGAGILSLPRLTASLGLLPALGLTALLGLGLAAVYARIVRTLHDHMAALVAAEARRGAESLQALGVSDGDLDRMTGLLLAEQARLRGIGILDELCAWLGLGRPGKFALLVGLLAYVVPATIGYVVVGSQTLAAVAALVTASGRGPDTPLALALALGLGSLAIGRQPPFPGQAACACILQMAASWAVGVAALQLLPPQPTMPALLFSLGTAATLLRSGQERGETPDGRIAPAHLVGTAIAVTELVLLLGTGLAALIVLGGRGEAQMPQPLLPPSLQFSDLSTAVGVLMFAYTGTGIFNLARYPRLFATESAGPRLTFVVAVGTLIPTIAYVAWMAVVALTLDPAALVEADRQTSYATIPLAAKVAAGGGEGWPIIVVGYFVALLAVTGAAAGFSESLADRLARVRQARRGEHTTAEAPAAAAVRNLQLGVLGLATAVAVALALVPPVLPFSALLLVAGNAGGGLLLLVLPFFLPTGGRRQPSKRDMTLVTVVALVLAAMNLSAIPAGFGQDPAATIAGGLILVIDLAFLGAFAWLVLAEGPEPPTELPGA